MESNHPPPLYQRGVLPLNYVPVYLKCVRDERSNQLSYTPALKISLE